MSTISNEWVSLEMREGIFKERSSYSWRPFFFLCVFVFLFSWSVPAYASVAMDKNALESLGNTNVSLSEVPVNINHDARAVL